MVDLEIVVDYERLKFFIFTLWLLISKCYCDKHYSMKLAAMVVSRGEQQTIIRPKPAISVAKYDAAGELVRVSDSRVKRIESKRFNMIGCGSRIC
jgi:hypothetical protein